MADIENPYKFLREVFDVLSKFHGLYVETSDGRVKLVYGGGTKYKGDPFMVKLCKDTNVTFLWLDDNGTYEGSGYNSWLLRMLKKGGDLVFFDDFLFRVPPFETAAELEMKLKLSGCSEGWLQ